MNLNQVIKFTNYKLFSKHKNGHGIHSPFVFDLILNVFNSKKEEPYYSAIEARRQDLLSFGGIILKNDFGALKSKKRSHKKVAVVAKNSLKQKKYSQLLSRIVKYYNYKNIIELGTSFGTTTAYLKFANLDSKITTIEGCENTVKIAKETFEILKIKDINIVNDKFDYVLETIINDYESLDFVFFDGNHKMKPTLKYFNICIEKINPQSVFIFDDIYWSKEMESAWKTIIKDKRAKITIDIFALGLVFFIENVEKQHFVIRY